MQKLMWISLLIFMPALAKAALPDASIEERDLRFVDASVNAVVRADASFKNFLDLKCELVGKKITISGDESDSSWFVTTKHGCGWGAALGPIWVLQGKFESRPKLILSTGGNAFYIVKSTHEMHHDVEIKSSTAGSEFDRRFIFRDKKYIEKY